jgi:hypothetical protein
MPVEAREQVCAPRLFCSGIGLRGPRVPAQTGPYPTGSPEVAGVKSEDWKALVITGRSGDRERKRASNLSASYTGVRAASNAVTVRRRAHSGGGA